VAYYVSKDTPVFSAFLDASKAFDRANHNLLFANLIKRNVPMSSPVATGGGAFGVLAPTNKAPSPHKLNYEAL